MSKIAIKAENISKQYRLGEIGTGTISHDLNRWWHKVRGKEDPFLKIGESNNRSQKGESDYVWSLKDINFEINQGDTVGIIGKNGAGKSTLLKLLSKVTKPTTGQFKVNGRIASLLEVGTGFHPEMTGRENIYLNGAILGMHRSEITRKFDEIVDFSGIERYIDTPVKRYSSGMYVRLAFAVAAHLESEILIVDEVLAVGDAEFQKKCLGKMGDVSLGEGRTVLFVSHNMAAVKELCNKGILLKNGQISYSGDIGNTLINYMTEPASIVSSMDFLKDSNSRRGNGEVRFTKVTVNNGDLTIDPTEDLRISLEAEVFEDVPSLYFNFSIFSSFDNSPLTSGYLSKISPASLNKYAKISFEVLIPKNTFRTGFFPVYLWLGKKGELAAENYPYDLIDKVLNLNFSTLKDREQIGYNSIEPNGYINIDYKIDNPIISHLE
jgi:lipopolysaccharide transport system ATP-binding protein